MQKNRMRLRASRLDICQMNQPKPDNGFAASAYPDLTSFRIGARGGTSGENISDEADYISDINPAVAVGISEPRRSRRRFIDEDVVDQRNRIGHINRAFVVDITQCGSPEREHGIGPDCDAPPPAAFTFNQ
jgi:hypothetical protein